MTRAEEIRNAIDKIIPISPSRNGRTYEQSLMATGFESGVKWADSNQKSPWISVEDDLPCYHADMINVFVKNVEWRTDRVLAMSDDGIMVVTYMYKLGSWSWYWNETDRITHWMAIPKLEEE